MGDPDGRGLRDPIKLVRHYDLLMTLQSTPVNHRPAGVRPVIIQLSVASTLLVSLTRKPACLRSFTRRSCGDRRPGRLSPERRSARWRRLSAENKVAARLVLSVVRQPITLRFSRRRKTPSRLPSRCRASKTRITTDIRGSRCLT